MSTATPENLWLQNFTRQAGIRRALVVHGNVLDVCYSPSQSQYQRVGEVLLEELRRRGFQRVILWDRFSGVQGLSPKEWAQLVEAATPTGGAAATGEAYDVGPTPGPASPSPAAAPSAEDFLAVVYHHMVNGKKDRYAFVLDWAEYLFGHAQSLSERERQWLLIIAKAVRNAPGLRPDQEALAQPTNLVVLLCPKLAVIPPVFYQGNPAVAEVSVPGPGHGERAEFLKRTAGQWKLAVSPKPEEVAFDDFVDALDGLTLVDLQQMIRLSRQLPGDPLTFERLINLYRYGERKSPWEDLSRTKLAQLQNSLTDRVKGQEDAVQKVTDVIIRAYTGLSGLQHSRRQRMPKGVLFFVGPTGVGKTELAKALAQFLFGDEESCLRFDMSEFNHEHSDQRLVGAPPGYVGHEEGGQLTNAVRRRPFSVLLFDEIEKAHVRILDKFLQILEDGRLTDGKGETVHFSETVIIFTSNIGASEVRLQEDAAAVREQFLQKVREHFVTTARRPELLNRIGDNIVPFNFIVNDDFLVDIARAKLQPLRDRLREKYRIRGLEFVDEKKALLALARAVDRRMGGRGLLNEIVKRIIDPLARFLFETEENPGAYAGRTIRVIQGGDSAQFGFELT